MGTALQALRRLEKRGALRPRPVDWKDELASWPEDLLEEWKERAAIMEVDGGLERDKAEREAFEVVKVRNTSKVINGNV